MEPIRKRPAALRTPWPPADASATENVNVADNWWTLATRHNRGDVWDIIYYNFETYNTQEVNWYMYERLGCRTTTADGRNYRFGRPPGAVAGIGDLVKQVLATPITVYIPPAHWLPPGPRQAAAKQAVLTVLRDRVASNLHFQIGSLELKTGDLLAVAQAIEEGRIQVIHRPSGGHMAAYWTDDRFVIPFGQLPPVGSRALIVHEAVHAAMDMRRVPLTMEQSEGLAYIAQALYLHHNGLDIAHSVVQPGFHVNAVNFVAWTGIFGNASDIAKAVASSTSVSNWDLFLLAASLRLAPTYQNQPAPNNDGVP
jgi:hypothetical protein